MQITAAGADFVSATPTAPRMYAIKREAEEQRWLWREGAEKLAA
jgi:hypothetical protein